MNGPFPSSTQAGSAQSYPLPITPSQQPTVVSQLPPVSRAQPSAIPFPSSERPMAPINTGSTPQLRPPLQSNSHSRTSSFFSFRNKSSTPSQSAGHIRSGSMGNGNGIGAGEFGTTSGPVQAPISSTQVQQQPSQSPVRIPSVLKKNSTQPASQVQPQPQPIAPQPIHPEIRSVIQLTTAHARKIYYSGPLVRRLERRTMDEKQREEVWFDVWAQLNGTTLSIWDMAQIQEASKQGKEVPPTYVNTTDAFVQVHGAVTTPETPTVPSKKYFNILALNTAGANILLFSCPDPRSLKSWAAALRLAAWEKSRLEEIYTAHLLRIMLKQPDAPSTLVRGRLEGWVRIRIAGQTDWKRMWMIVSVGAGSGHPEHPPPNAGSIGSTPTPIPTVPRKGRMSSLFSSRDTSVVLPSKPIVSLYASQKPKDKKKALLSFKDVTQAFAVYPERPELISRSTLIKVEGTFGDEEVAGQMRNRQGWLLMMPDLEGSVGQAEEMLKWVIALHDAFELYGRPKPWTWDPRDPVSLMFAYPVGPNRDLLFLDRELAEILDPRDEHTSSIRSRLIGILLDRMRGHDPRPAPSDLPPSLPPIGNNVVAVPQQQTPSAPAPQPVSNVSGSSFQLPPLSFGATTLPDDEKPLSPVRRQSNADAAGNSYNSPVQAPPPQSHYIGQTTSTVTPEANVFDRPVTNSPAPASPPQSISGVESSMQSPQPSISNVTAPGRHSFDTPSLNRGFQVPSSPSRVDSTTSSTSVFSKSENRSYNDGSNPLVSKSPLSSSTEASHATSSTAPLPSHSPPSYTPSTLATSHAEFGAGPPLVTVPKRSISVLTSPHSVFAQDDESSQPSFEIPDHASILTSPHSIAGAHPTLTSPYSPRGTIRSIDGRSSFGPVSRPVSSIGAQPAGIRSEDSGNLLSEAGALYYMQQQQSDDVAAHPRRVPTTINEQSDSDSDDDEESQHAPSRKSSRAGAVSPVSNDSTHSRNRPVRQSTPMAFFDRSSPIPTSTVSAVAPADRQSPSRQGLGRKPSGARAQATTRAYNPVESISSQPVTEEETQSDDHYETPLQARMDQIQIQPSASSEADLDALAVLSYLSVDDKPPSPKQTSVEPLNIQKTPSPGPVAGETPSQFKSSFAPSKQAAERKAKAQAQQAAHQIATHKPGRANGKRKSRVAGAWNESSDEEEEEEEDDDDDDDDDADSDAEPSLANKQNSGSGSSTTSLQQRQQQPSEQIGEQQYSHLRPPRSLPQVPANNYQEEYNPPPRRMVPDQYSAAGGPLPRTLHDGTQIRTQAEFPQPGAARQTLWSQVLDPGRASNIEPPRNDTFVQLEPAETMTKAFTPQGLLSAGIQDKQDRSAKRQEELARETGASLINVPNKPPPPQMGLLGAITAHERERKREGGVGAALTEREREKRVAEDRQRRFDEHQRQQLDQMQQGGSIYGGQFPPYGMNPMMMMNPMMGMNPMMTGGGMNPMMTGGGMGGVPPMMTGQMGYPGMMPGYNPQHLFAAQQAAQAYQQAMMAFSVAGSQVGEGAGAPPLNPNMTGGNMAGNMGFDPRMSMMGMPTMGQMGQMVPMGMQMTGMSTFDSRFPPNANDPGLAPPSGLGAQDLASRNSSPARRSSPLARQTDSGGPSPRAESPKP